MTTKSSTSGARRADVTGFGVPQHLGDGSALPQSVESGNLSLEIWSIGWMSVLSSQRKTCEENTKSDLGEWRCTPFERLETFSRSFC
jgi:hypothetical protein